MTTYTRRQFITTMTTATVLPGLARAQTSVGVPRLRCRFADQDFTFRLEDNATVRDLVSLLPLELSITDFSSNEKVSHLPRRLDETGRQPITDEMPGDLCYFRGWGSLAFFYDAYIYRDDLILLGKIEGGVDPLLVKGEYPMRLDLAS